MPTLIELMKDPSVVVRDTTAWTVGRICELLPEAAINDVYLAPLLQCLIEGLSAEPRVASNVCWVRDFLPGEDRCLSCAIEKEMCERKGPTSLEDMFSILSPNIFS